jgi:alpha-L-arabinofuranosidase
VDVLAAVPTVVWVALESADGSTVYAEQSLSVTSNNWQHLNFTLTPSVSAGGGRFAIKLKQPGSVVVGYAFLQPGAWGCFQGLPVRKDVAQGLINQGITVLRYGGSMVNASGYRWKKMIGPRDRRAPYEGTWYPYSSDGWGIFDFLNLCEASGITGIPDLNINESPNDMADFMDYLNGTPDSEWGKKRVADGHLEPYHLKYIELGNEERVDDNYFKKFKAIAEVIWAKDPAVILIVGDFSYHKVITDPFNFTGADGGIKTLAGQQKILQLAKQHDREVWFDLHVWTDGPRPDSTLASMFSYIDAMDKIADGAKHKVLVFELNALNHSQRRALANALAMNAIQRDGRLPITCSANCLQPDGQNENGWNQGLLFLNPSQVWLQPPGYVTKMYSENYQPVEVRSSVSDSNNDLDVSSQLSQDGKTLVLKVVNLGEKVASASIRIHGYSPAHPAADVEEISGSLPEANTATMPQQIQSIRKQWQPRFENGKAEYDFQPHSFTVIKFN